MARGGCPFLSLKGRICDSCLLLLSLFFLNKGTELLSGSKLGDFPCRNGHGLACGGIAALALLVLGDLEGAKALDGDGIATDKAVRDGRDNDIQSPGCIGLGHACFRCNLLYKF